MENTRTDIAQKRIQRYFSVSEMILSGIFNRRDWTEDVSKGKTEGKEPLGKNSFRVNKDIVIY